MGDPEHVEENVEEIKYFMIGVLDNWCCSQK